MLDLFRRYVVGWLVVTRQTAALAQRFIAQCCNQQGIEPGQLMIHADRGPPMTAKTTTQLLADLGIGQSHGRPHVSNDNPFSESHLRDAQVSTGVSRPVRVPGARRGMLAGVLHVVQRPTLPQRDRLADAGVGALWRGRGAPAPATGGANAGVCTASEAFRTGRTRTAVPPDEALDQPTVAGPTRGGSCTLNLSERCLKVLDIFR